MIRRFIKKINNVLFKFNPVSKKNYLTQKIGTTYGGYNVFDKYLKKPIVISCGLGEDASFDLDMIKKYDAKIISIDPTPRAKDHYYKIVENFGKANQLEYNESGNLNIKCYDLRKVNKNNLVYSIGSLVAGESIKSKVKRLKKIIENEKIDNLFISSGENVCWLLNIRGKDLPNSPIANFQAIITKKKEIILFGNIKKLKNISKKFIKEK